MKKDKPELDNKLIDRIGKDAKRIAKLLQKTHRKYEKKLHYSKLKEIEVTYDGVAQKYKINFYLY